ncbi:MAG: OmpA family protein [Methylacidiphilales bacterium]|nr:OmpA family protein [Candidatus Methylacidiphilales bacterium]MDW8349873.1 OmpA family protein [Verrucomicrobiae bacterium]
MKEEFVKVLCLIAVVSLISACSPSSKRFGGANYDGGMYGESLPETDNLGNPYYGSENINDMPAADRPSGAALRDANYSIFKNQTIYFEFDSTGIRASERGKLEEVARETKVSGYRLLLAGHCDERGTFEYNRGLGERRALSVREYLVGLGLNPGDISTISYGEERPAVSGSNETAWAKNRRVEIAVVGR